MVDAAMLRTLLSQPEVSSLHHEQDDVRDTQASHISKYLDELGEEIIMEQAIDLADRLDYDPSLLKPEQRKAIFMTVFAVNLKAWGLRSPQYYQDKSQCLSVSETAWPGAVAVLKAEHLKRGYIEPKELIKRLRELKPSNNFKLRPYIHRAMRFDRSPLYENTDFLIAPPLQKWIDRQIEGRFKAHMSHTRLWSHLEKPIQERWAELKGTLYQADSSDVPFFKNVGHSRGGTLFPRYLVKGLQALRKEADDMGRGYYEEEDEKLETARQEAIDGWREINPNISLACDPMSLYTTWPRDLMDQLDEICREAIRRGKQRYFEHLKEKEREMQVLIDFWRGCGLITGQRTPPSPQWPDPLKGKEQPKYLIDRLSELKTQLGQNDNSYRMRQCIEITRWKEAVLNGNSEPTAADTPFPQFLMDELAEIWQDYDDVMRFEREDEMIERIMEWRESKTEGIEQLITLAQREMPKKSDTVWSNRLRPRKKATGLEDQTGWPARPRSRHGTVGATVMKPKAAAKPTDRPRKIIKKYDKKASKTMRHPPSKGLATKPTKQKAENTPSYPDEAPPPAKHARIANAKGAKNAGRQSTVMVQPQDLRKAVKPKRQSGTFQKKEHRSTQ